jgi:hypothetical protein
VKDTSPEMASLYHDLLISKTGEERFMMGVSLCETARRIVLSSFPKDISETEIRIRLLYRYYSNDFSPTELKAIEESLKSNP